MNSSSSGGARVLSSGRTGFRSPNWGELQRSAARLLDYEFDALLLCDGQPLPSGGKDKLRELVVRSGD
jgi:hypothetical protein